MFKNHLHQVLSINITYEIHFFKCIFLLIASMSKIKIMLTLVYFCGSVLTAPTLMNPKMLAAFLKPGPVNTAPRFLSPRQESSYTARGVNLITWLSYTGRREIENQHGRHPPGFGVVDSDPYCILIQELCGSGPVFRIRIRIHTCKYMAVLLLLF